MDESIEDVDGVCCTGYPNENASDVLSMPVPLLFTLGVNEVDGENRRSGRFEVKDGETVPKDDGDVGDVGGVIAWNEPYSLESE